MSKEVTIALSLNPKTLVAALTTDQLLSLIVGIDAASQGWELTTRLHEHFAERRRVQIQEDRETTKTDIKLPPLVPVEVGQLVQYTEQGVSFIAKILDDRGPLGIDGEHVFLVKAVFGDTTDAYDLPHRAIRSAWWASAPDA